MPTVLNRDTRTLAVLGALVASVIGLSCVLTGAPAEFGGRGDVAPVVSRGR